MCIIKNIYSFSIGIKFHQLGYWGTWANHKPTLIFSRSLNTFQAPKPALNTYTIFKMKPWVHTMGINTVENNNPLISFFLHLPRYTHLWQLGVSYIFYRVRCVQSVNNILMTMHWESHSLKVNHPHEGQLEPAVNCYHMWIITSELQRSDVRQRECTDFDEYSLLHSLILFILISLFVFCNHCLHLSC